MTLSDPTITRVITTNTLAQAQGIIRTPLIGFWPAYEMGMFTNKTFTYPSMIHFPMTLSLKDLEGIIPLNEKAFPAGTKVWTNKDTMGREARVIKQGTELKTIQRVNSDPAGKTPVMQGIHGFYVRSDDITATPPEPLAVKIETIPSDTTLEEGDDVEVMRDTVTRYKCRLPKGTKGKVKETKSYGNFTAIMTEGTNGYFQVLTRDMAKIPKDETKRETHDFPEVAPKPFCVTKTEEDGYCTYNFGRHPRGRTVIRNRPIGWTFDYDESRELVILQHTNGATMRAFEAFYEDTWTPITSQQRKSNDATTN